MKMVPTIFFCHVIYLLLTLLFDVTRVFFVSFLLYLSFFYDNMGAPFCFLLEKRKKTYLKNENKCRRVKCVQRVHLTRLLKNFGLYSIKTE